ncbi:uncharacterized protein V1516DRAFT_264048 [Lipomyces oligophaga]|uniref:uncharacterized protein n=1 Tax=Lipomyces oligophaga TaxID=45792 RepID=UPI0034CECE70
MTRSALGIPFHHSTCSRTRNSRIIECIRTPSCIWISEQRLITAWKKFVHTTIDRQLPIESSTLVRKKKRKSHETEHDSREVEISLLFPRGQSGWRPTTAANWKSTFFQYTKPPHKISAEMQDPVDLWPQLAATFKLDPTIFDSGSDRNKQAEQMNAVIRQTVQEYSEKNNIRYAQGVSNVEEGLNKTPNASYQQLVEPREQPSDLWKTIRRYFENFVYKQNDFSNEKNVSESASAFATEIKSLESSSQSRFSSSMDDYVLEFFHYLKGKAQTEWIDSVEKLETLKIRDKIRKALSNLDSPELSTTDMMTAIGYTRSDVDFRELVPDLIRHCYDHALLLDVIRFSSKYGDTDRSLSAIYDLIRDSRDPYVTLSYLVQALIIQGRERISFVITKYIVQRMIGAGNQLFMRHIDPVNVDSTISTIQSRARLEKSILEAPNSQAVESILQMKFIQIGKFNEITKLLRSIEFSEPQIAFRICESSLRLHKQKFKVDLETMLELTQVCKEMLLARGRSLDCLAWLSYIVDEDTITPVWDLICKPDQASIPLVRDKYIDTNWRISLHIVLSFLNRAMALNSRVAAGNIYSSNISNEARHHMELDSFRTLIEWTLSPVIDPGALFSEKEQARQAAFRLLEHQIPERIIKCFNRLIGEVQNRKEIEHSSSVKAKLRAVLDVGLQLTLSWREQGMFENRVRIISDAAFSRIQSIMQSLDDDQELEIELVTMYYELIGSKFALDVIQSNIMRGQPKGNYNYDLMTGFITAQRYSSQTELFERVKCLKLILAQLLSHRDILGPGLDKSLKETGDQTYMISRPETLRKRALFVITLMNSPSVIGAFRPAFFI